MVQGGCTALMVAAAKGHDGIVGLLVKAGADVTAQGGSPRKTALEWAKQANHAKCAAILEAATSAGLQFHEAGNRRWQQKKFGEAAKLYTMALR